jgi:hypothetical protein
MTPSILSSATLRDGRIVAIATERAHNSIHAFDGKGWSRVVRWAGHEVTAACACGQTVVCAALDDVVYLIDGKTISRVPLPKQSDWIYGAAVMSDETALLGGAGLFVIGVKDQSVIRRRLSEFNISRPGRDILSIVRTGGRTLLLGKKNLLVEYKDDSAVELVDRKAMAGRELMFKSAVQIAQDLWLSGFGPQPFLARLAAGRSVQFEDLPITGQSSPSLAELNGELLVGTSRLQIGNPGRWRDLLPAPLTNSSIVGIIPTSTAAATEACALSHDGKSYFTDGKTVKELPVF